MRVTDHVSLLETLRLPARFERLVERVGQEVAAVLVPPSETNMDVLAQLADAVRSQDEGMLVPLYGRTGAGKTTFASSVTQWMPAAFAPTVIYEGKINFDDLKIAVEQSRSSLAAIDRRIIPVMIDHREANPPSAEEMSIIKRFVRSTAGGDPSVVFWPETDEAVASEMSARFIDIAGNQPIHIPLGVDGPDRKFWHGIAESTLKLSNDIDSLSDLGVNPANYDVGQFRTIGDFLRKISGDFNHLLFDLRKSLAKEVEILLLFISESAAPGVLSQLINPSRYGLLDGNALLAATPDSVVGRWWSNKKGLLTRTIVQLNARALCLPPVTTVSCLRNCGPADDPLFETIGIPRVGASRAVRDLERSDVGKILIGQDPTRFEARGTPASESLAAFQLLAEAGLSAGRDKKMNSIIGEAFGELLERNQITYNSIKSEQVLEFAPIIPDTRVEFDKYILCIEFIWRSGDFLQTKRSVVASYILNKLRNYARELKWTAD